MSYSISINGIQLCNKKTDLCIYICTYTYIHISVYLTRLSIVFQIIKFLVEGNLKTDGMSCRHHNYFSILQCFLPTIVITLVFNKWIFSCLYLVSRILLQIRVIHFSPLIYLSSSYRSMYPKIFMFILWTVTHSYSYFC